MTIKKVVTNHQSINISDLNSENLVILKCDDDFYKLHFSVGKYSFVSLQDSKCFANGFHSSINSVIKSTKGEVYVLDNIKEISKL